MKKLTRVEMNSVGGGAGGSADEIGKAAKDEELASPLRCDIKGPKSGSSDTTFYRVYYGTSSNEFKNSPLVNLTTITLKNNVTLSVDCYDVRERMASRRRLGK